MSKEKSISSSVTSSESLVLRNLSYYFIFIVIALLLLGFSLGFLHIASESLGSNAILLGSFAYLVFLLIGLVFCFFSQEKKAFFGFLPLKDSKKRLLEVSLFSFLFCVGIVFLKYFVLKYWNLEDKYDLLVMSNYSSSLLVGLLEYSLFVPVQVFIFHSFVQSPLIHYLNIQKGKFFFSVFISFLIFSYSHLLLGVNTVILLSPVLLVWCYLFSKHRCFYTVFLSHLIIGGLGLFVIGVNPFVEVLNSWSDTCLGASSRYADIFRSLLGSIG